MNYSYNSGIAPTLLESYLQRRALENVEPNLGYLNDAQLIEQPKNTTVAAGTQVSFTVKASGVGTLKYQWQYSTNGTSWNDTTLTGYNTAKLTLTATLMDAGRIGTEDACIESSDESVLTVENGAAVAHAPGLCLVKMSMERGGVKKSCCLPFLVRE